METSTPTQPTTEETKLARRYDIDWLRVLAMLTIFLYHSGRPFTVTPWAIMNSEPDVLFTLANIFVTGWIMPLFFVISGMATYYSLAKRSSSQYVKSRFIRLMIPFIFALFVILPFDRYYELVFNGHFNGSFRDFYFWTYFSRINFTGGWINVFPFDFNLRLTYLAGSNQGLYLWYLWWLFVFSLITVHLFKYLRKEEMRQKISKLATISNQRGGIFVLAIPLIIVDLVALPPYFTFPSSYGGWKLPTYLVFFILAYLLASDSNLKESVDKNGRLALILGIITSLLIILLFGIVGETVLEEGFPNFPLYFLFTSIWAFNGWCWIVFILSFGHKRFNFNHRYLQIANELVLPFYILHETIIIIMAFYIIGFELIVIFKYLLIVISSFAIISILLVPIRQINILRFLFGLPKKKRTKT